MYVRQFKELKRTIAITDRAKIDRTRFSLSGIGIFLYISLILMFHSVLTVFTFNNNLSNIVLQVAGICVNFALSTPFLKAYVLNKGSDSQTVWYEMCSAVPSHKHSMSLVHLFCFRHIKNFLFYN